MEDLKTETIKQFREKFTAVVSYEKFSDESEAQRLPEPVRLWQDFVKNEPQIVESWLSESIDKIQEETRINTLKEVNEVMLKGEDTDVTVVRFLRVKDFILNGLKRI